MADLKDLLKSKKVKEFVRKEKSRPWTVLGTEDNANSWPTAPSEQKPTTKAKPVTEYVTEPITTETEPVTKPVTEYVTEPVTTETDPVTTRRKKLPEPVTKPVTTKSQTRNEPVTEPVTEITVVQLQRRVLFYIHDRCRQTGSLTSPLITKEEMREACKSNTGSLRGIIIKLEKKGYLRRVSFKNGVAGGVNFQIPERIFQTLTLVRTRNEPVTILRKPVTEYVTEPITQPSSSSSYLDLNKTTTTGGTAKTPEKFSNSSTDPAWSQIDHVYLQDIGFNASHVAQVQKLGVHTPKSLQDSIYAFKFDLNANGRGSKISGEPLNFFMGILRKGPYAPPQNYESPEDRQLREYLEGKEKLLEKRRENLNRVKELEFEEWMDSLSKLEKETLAPMGTSETVKRPQLRNHFDEHIWEEKKKELIEGFGREGTSELLLSIEKSDYDKASIPPLNPP